MKFTNALSLAGLLAAMICGAAAQAQSPNQIPLGAATGMDRPPAGSRAPSPANPPAAHPSSRPASPTASQGVTSLRCSQLADTKGLRRNARKSFINKCMKKSGR